MRRPTIFAISAFAVLGFTLVSAPAQADSIKDPFIGVRGGDGSDPITNGAAIQLQQCGSLDSSVAVSGIENFFCAQYQFLGTEGFVNPDDYAPMITSFDLAFWDANGAALQTQVCELEFCTSLFFPSGASQFRSVETIDDFVVRLSAMGPGDYCEYEFCFDPPIFPGHLLLFVENVGFSGGFISVQAVNGISDFQTNLATPGKDLDSVPEPATLALLGTGMLGAALQRRLRRRRGSPGL